MMKLSKTLCATLAIGALGSQFADSPVAAQTTVQTDGARVQVDAEPTQVDPVQQRNEPNTSEPYDNRRGQARVDRQAIEWLIIDQQSMIELVDIGLAKTETPEVRELAEKVKQDHATLLTTLREKSLSLRSSVSTQGTSQGEPDTGTRRPEPETTSTLPGAGQPQGADSARAEARRAAREAARDSQREAEADDERQPLENLTDRVGDRAQNLADRTRNAAEGVRDAIDRNLGPEATPSSTPERREMLRRAGGEVANVIRSTNEAGSSVHRQISSQLIVLAERELQQREGKELDGAFLGMLTASHLREEATLVTFHNRVSPELRPMLDAALEKTRQHLQQAESLMSQLGN